MKYLNLDATTVATIGVIAAITRDVIVDLDGHGLSIYGDESRDNQDVVLNRVIAARLNNVIATTRGQ